VSLENQVTEDTPPAFLWHTQEDGTVPVENTLMFASALRRANVPFELHGYQHGGHGLSLSDPEVYGKKGTGEEYAHRMPELDRHGSGLAEGT
jgi:acetyl esterase/lipase